MFLQVVALARNVRGDLHAVGEAYTSDLSDGRVWLAGSLGRDACAHTALEGCRIEGRAILKGVETARKRDCLRAPGLFDPSLARKLIYCRHFK